MKTKSQKVFIFLAGGLLIVAGICMIVLGIEMIDWEAYSHNENLKMGKEQIAGIKKSITKENKKELEEIIKQMEENLKLFKILKQYIEGIFVAAEIWPGILMLVVAGCVMFLYKKDFDMAYWIGLTVIAALMPIGAIVNAFTATEKLKYEVKNSKYNIEKVNPKNIPKSLEGMEKGINRKKSLIN